MGTLTNLNAGGLPPEFATDSEVAAAIASHIPGDPHPQYVLERLSSDGSVLPLLFRKPAPNSQFDANTWNPNQGQAHFSAINVASGGSFIPSGLPPMQLIQVLQGTLIQVEPFSDQGNTAALQFFVGAGVWLRTIGQQWVSLAFLNQPNFFTTVQNFLQGVTIGSSGTLIKKILSQEFTINPPLLASGQSQYPGIPLTINGAALGDLIYISPIEVDIIFTSIWPFEFRGVVTAANTVTVYPLNDWTGGNLDLAPFKIRVVVMGF